VRLAAAGLHDAGTDVRWHGRRIRGVSIPRQSAEALRSGVREALTNVQRHAAARSASVRAAALPDRVEVVVHDDGHGFDVAAPGGFGIQHSIVGRLRDAGGGAQIRSGPGGTTVTMWVPR
jgi:signal transduction histidine kinase